MKRYAKDDKWAFAFHDLLAKISFYQGDARQAALLLQAYPPTGFDHEFLIRRYLLLAMAEARLGHGDLSNKALLAAKTLEPTGELMAEVLGTEGNLALAHFKLEDAQRFYLLALQRTRDPNSFEAMQWWLNLGVAALQLEHHEDAIDRLGKAASIAMRIGAQQAIEKALGNLGWAYYQVGDFAYAQQNLEAALKQAEALDATLDEVHWLTDIGMSEFERGQIREAKASLERSLTLAGTLNNSDQMHIAHIRLALLLVHSEPDVAKFHVLQAERIASSEHDSIGLLEPALIRAFLLAQDKDYKAAIRQLRLLVKRTLPLPEVEWLAESTLADLYSKSNRPRLAERWYQRAIDTFHRQRLTLKSVELELPFLENGSDLYMGYMEHLIRAGRTGEALSLLDTSRAETLAEGLGDAPAKEGKAIDPRAVAERLGATILVYCLRPERSYLWAITGKEQGFYALPGSVAILPLVARHNEAILGSKDLLAQKDSTGRALYDALLAPAAELLPKNGGRVVLVADSALSRLNFETLIAPGDPEKGEASHYWIEDASVTNARSLRLLAAGGKLRRPVKAKSQTAPKLLLIGDPVYAKGEYAPLPNAGAEMAGIAGHFASAERVVASGRDASPEAYPSSRPGRFRFLHFVAHATASELNPLDSAVILSSKGNGAAGLTNKLYASEILKQPLSAELVTLSSCYSSGTRNYTGEGVVGLAWAFLRAGAHSVIGALWEVSDMSTPKLMDTMYTRLLAGDAPDAALRAAKLEMLRSDGVFRKPVYWGAFQLYAGR